MEPETKKKKMKSILTLSLLLSITIFSCQPQEKVNENDFPDPVDTTDKLIQRQEKKQYAMDGIYFDNRFAAARLNGVAKKNDSTFQLKVSPENKPINSSPWYAFKVHSENPANLFIELHYGEYKHRYHPKVSRDGNYWVAVDTSLFIYNQDSSSLTFPLSVSPDTTWVSAQEIFNTAHLNDWCEELSKHVSVSRHILGKSREGRDLHYIDINQGTKANKKLIVLMSRQHPPEVTGFFAMQSFVEAILQSEKTEEFLSQYRVLVYPMLNPDGVDMGHWRHNTGGVDLNRDWAYYRQEEIRQVASHLIKEVQDHGHMVALGLDFHSTYNDVYYTQSKNLLKTPTTSWFRDQWFARLEARIPGYKVNEKPSGLGKPVSKSWFYTQFGAEGMTYEIGDKTPRDSIHLIGKVAGEEMMNVLLANDF